MMHVELKNRSRKSSGKKTLRIKGSGHEKNYRPFYFALIYMRGNLSVLRLCDRSSVWIGENPAGNRHCVRATDQPKKSSKTYGEAGCGEDRHAVEPRRVP